MSSFLQTGVSVFTNMTPFFKYVASVTLLISLPAAFDQSVRSRLERRGGVRRVLVPVAALATLALAVGVWLGEVALEPEPAVPAQAAVETVTDEVNDIDWALSLADVEETSEHGFLPEEYQTIAALFLDEIDAP